MISGTGLGFAAGSELTGRKKTLEMILRMIILLRGEIRYGNKSLYDAFTGASGNWQESTENFLYLLHRKCGKKQAHHLEKSSGIAPKNV